MSDLKALIEAAKKATPGPWFQTGAPWFRDGTGVLAGSPDGNIAFLIADTDDFALPRDEYEGFPLGDKEDDARFIALANPSTVAAMAEELLKLREALKFYRDEFKPKIHKKQVPGASNITFHPSEALLEDCGNRAMMALSTLTQDSPNVRP